jgi:hypothetical protein
MKKRFLFLVFVILVVLATFTLYNDTLPQIPKDNSYFQQNSISTSYETIDYLIEISLGTEFGQNQNRNQPTLIKWVKPEVTIKLHGDFNQALNDCLDQVISDFNNLSQTTKLSLNAEQGDIDLYLIPKEQFSTIESNYVADNEGFFWFNWNEDNVLTKATILINSNDSSRDKERCHLIREELTQSMGLAQDSYKYEDSIFYAPWTTTLTYADIDKKIIQLLYSSGLKPKMTEQEIRDYFMVKE